MAGVQFPPGLIMDFFFLLATASRPALELTQPRAQWVLGTLTPGVKRSASVEVKNAWNYTSTQQCFFMARCLIKHRDKFTFTFTFTLIFKHVFRLRRISRT